MRRKALDIMHDPYLERLKTQVHESLKSHIGISWMISLITFGGLILFWVLKGFFSLKRKRERGAQIAHPRKIRLKLCLRKTQSDLKLDGLPLVKGKETSHMILTGTSGSGKTNAYHTLLPQIQKRPNKAIVVVLTGDYVERYYRPEKDLILNPLDKRSVDWLPWSDCLQESHYEALSAAIVPKSKTYDPFWETAGKAILAAALRKFKQQEKFDVQNLLNLLVREDLTDFCKFFRGTDAAAYTHKDGEKMTISVRSTLANHVQSFKYLKNTDAPFSIREWVAKETPDQWLFITSRPDQRETLRPLMSGWLDTAINALMTLPPNSDRRFWLLMDELPALQKVPILKTALAEGRKYGLCVVAGIQNIPQLAHTYGQNESQSLLDLFNTKVFFRNTDPHTTQWISKVLGEAETTESVENVSYGANTMRDGVSLSQNTRTKSLILPTEIASLRDLEAYIKLPSSLPITKMKMRYKDRPKRSPAFDLLSNEELIKRQKVIKPDLEEEKEEETSNDNLQEEDLLKEVML